MLNQSSKSVTVDLPKTLFSRFKRTSFMKNANTLSEGIRSALSKSIELDTQSQEKNENKINNKVA